VANGQIVYETDC